MNCVLMSLNTILTTHTLCIYIYKYRKYCSIKTTMFEILSLKTSPLLIFLCIQIHDHVI